eukprot:1161469-Pelagomonas_calceolata.AAC.42
MIKLLIVDLGALHLHGSLTCLERVLQTQDTVLHSVLHTQDSGRLAVVQDVWKYCMELYRHVWVSAVWQMDRDAWVAVAWRCRRQ